MNFKGFFFHTFNVFFVLPVYYLSKKFQVMLGGLLEPIVAETTI